MFDGDQLHQFIASSRASLPIPLSFSLHGNPSNFSAAFDPYSSLHGHLHHQQPPNTAAAKNNNIVIDEKHVGKYSTNLALESERSMDPWSNDEVLALLKVRSSMEIWVPDFTWEHVSRKLGELGYKRSADECKDKFEEESRQFNSKNYRIFGEFDEFYTAAADHHQQEEGRRTQTPEKAQNTVEEEEKNVNPPQESEEVAKKPLKNKRKRSSSRDKFEKFKGFCEGVVKKMMAHQEEMHNKLINDIVKRDEENISREEAWKNLEINRIQTEIEIRTKEQANAVQRQEAIIQFLNKFTSHHQDQNPSNSSKTPQTQITTTSPSPASPSSVLATKTSKPNTASLSSLDHTTSTSDPTLSSETGSNTGKRWPREEVRALINLRCKMSSNNEGIECKEIQTKGPLWERISQGMMELGYRRSAKRCKEKWENINKYFRKTKDSSKKRSVNSRTCPYFHQLSCLYSEGTIVAPTTIANSDQ